MEVKVLNKEGKATTKKVKLNDRIFAVDPNDHAIYLDVKQYLANQRQGTHQARERGEIIGSTRKIKKQKGTRFYLSEEIEDVNEVSKGEISIKYFNHIFEKWKLMFRPLKIN